MGSGFLPSVTALTLTQTLLTITEKKKNLPNSLFVVLGKKANISHLLKPHPLSTGAVLLF